MKKVEIGVRGGEGVEEEVVVDERRSCGLGKNVKKDRNQNTEKRYELNPTLLLGSVLSLRVSLFLRRYSGVLNIFLCLIIAIFHFGVPNSI